LRRVLVLGDEDHAHRTLLDLGGNFGDFLMLAPFSIEGASSKSGAVHSAIAQRRNVSNGRLKGSPGKPTVCRAQRTTVISASLRKSLGTKWAHRKTPTSRSAHIQV
jgi:hypothetical protein